MTSCGSDGDAVSTPVSYDIVQLKSQTAEEGSVFSLYLPGSTEEIVYTDNRAVIDTSKVAIGERLLLGYVPGGAPYVSGKVETRGYSLIQNGLLLVSMDGVDESMPDWRRDGIYLYSIWRSGDFINVHARFTYSEKPRSLSLVVDKEDVAARNPHPTLRLVYRMDVPDENFEREGYSSFDISALWNCGWITGVTVELANTNLEIDKFSFEK